MSKEKKNLIFDADQYNAYYGNFRGVDFSNDHTQVNRQRFAYLVNMYKDYQSAQGQAIETIPGFRAVANFREDAPVYGIHEYTFRRQNKNYPIVLFHVGTKLYVWRKGTYPEGVNVEKSTVITLPKPGVDSSGLNVFTIAFTDSSDKEAVYGIYKLDGTAIEVWDFSPYILTIKSGGLFEGDMVRVVYAENEWKNANILFTEMNEMKTDEAKLFKALDNMEAVVSHNEADISTWIPLEYTENLIYGEQNCQWSEWTKNLRAQLKKDSEEKIAKESK